MRLVLLALGVAAAVLIGYSFRAPSLNAQVPIEDWLPFTAGQTVTLSVDLPGSIITCKVTQVVNGFIGCAKDERQKSAERWINLRNVQTITPAGR